MFILICGEDIFGVRVLIHLPGERVFLPTGLSKRRPDRTEGQVCKALYMMIHCIK